MPRAALRRGAGGSLPPAGKRRIANGCGPRGWKAFALDYADEASIAAAVAEVLARTGGTLDALFNNGAFACPGAVEDLPRDALREIFETNLFGYHDLTRRVIPVMRAQGHGRIVNCSSVLGLVGVTWRGAYVATKFAMEGLTDVLRIEMQGTGIEVILIEPGPIATKNPRKRHSAFRKLDRLAGLGPARRNTTHLRGRLYDEKRDGPVRAAARSRDRQADPRAGGPAPRARYYVTMPTYLMGIARRLLPTRALDWLLARG